MLQRTNHAVQLSAETGNANESAQSSHGRTQTWIEPLFRILNISNVNVPMDATCASTILSGCIQVNFWQRLTKLSAKEIEAYHISFTFQKSNLAKECSSY